MARTKNVKSPFSSLGISTTYLKSSQRWREEMQYIKEYFGITGDADALRVVVHRFYVQLKEKEVSSPTQP